MKSIKFLGPRRVCVEESNLPELLEGHVRIRTLCSGISVGTERLVYRGALRRDIALDPTIRALSGQFEYPFVYGYACVGVVEAVGSGLDAAWLGRRVFAFAPHASHHVLKPEALQLVPESVPDDLATLFPSFETALAFVHDGAPRLGERVLVAGLGIVGLATVALLSRFPLAALYGVDPLAHNRAAAQALGAIPLTPEEQRSMFTQSDVGPSGVDPSGVDLSFEISGKLPVLGTTIESTAAGGRVIVGSWYGDDASTLTLGTHFHRGHLELKSSQVSEIPAPLQALWTKPRRFEQTWRMLSDLATRGALDHWVTHHFPVDEAERLYRGLDLGSEGRTRREGILGSEGDQPLEDHLHVVLTY